MKSNSVLMHAKALAEILSKDLSLAKQKEISENFLKLLKDKGMQNKADLIIALTEDLLLQERGGRKITITTARKLSAKLRETLKKYIHDNDVVSEEVDSSLIAGVKIVINNTEQFDMSLKNKLDKIYVTRNN